MGSNKPKNWKYVVSSKQDIDKLNRALRDKFIKSYRAAIEEAVKELYDYIIEVLDSQRYKWKPLKKKYKKKKLKKGLSGKILIATGEYYESIEYKIDNKTVWVGVPDRTHKESGLPLGRLARIHEFGSKVVEIPSRPLWRPALSWWVRKWNKNNKHFVITKITDEIKKEL